MMQPLPHSYEWGWECNAHNGGRTQLIKENGMNKLIELVYAGAFVSAAILGAYKLLCLLLGVA